MKIRVRIKEVYGVQTVYPVCSQAELFARIAGTKTLTPATLRAVEALGYTVEIEPAHVVAW